MADGLAAGKGVVVAMSLDEAHAAIDFMLLDNKLGVVHNAGESGQAVPRVVIEEFLEGEEASFMVLCDGKDVVALATSYREYGAMFMRGVRPRDVLMYWGGDERGSDYDRGSDAARDFPICVPISTQCLHAAGSALAFKLQNKPQVAVTVCGDGGSSKTDFYAAVNSAGAYQLPLILCVVNNGWAISVPRSAQTGAETLAQKGLAGGLHCLQVDGNDLIAVLAAMEQARERALSGQGGTVLELLTYRLSDHTTADDARRYRDDAEVKAAWLKEPLIRLRKYLTAQGVWSEEEEKNWIAECGARVDEEVNAYLNCPVQPVEAMFDYLYADPPPDLLAQRAAAIALEQRHG